MPRQDTVSGNFLELPHTMNNWSSFLRTTRNLTTKAFDQRYKKILENFFKNRSVNYRIACETSATNLADMAVEEGNLHVIKFFIKKNANFTLLDSAGLTVLDNALMLEKWHIVVALLKAGAVINYRILTKINTINLHKFFVLTILFNKLKFFSALNPVQKSLVEQMVFSAKQVIAKKIINNEESKYLSEYLANQLNTFTRIIARAHTTFSKQKKIDFMVNGVAVSFAEHVVESVIKVLEKKAEGLSYLTCGLLLQRCINNHLPKRLTGPDREAYNEKRIHDAISFYIKSMQSSDEFTPFIKHILADLKMNGPASVQTRLYSFDLSPEIPTHVNIQLPSFSRYFLFQKVDAGCNSVNCFNRLAKTGV